MTTRVEALPDTPRRSAANALSIPGGAAVVSYRPGDITTYWIWRCWRMPPRVFGLEI